ncbi:MAG: potassium-transporting ATPase subunit KdpC [Candidatus Nanopelagicales bacterium]
MTLYVRQAVTAVLAIVVFTVLVGVVYPFAVWAVGRVAASGQAAGSYVTDANGAVVGSSLIGQNFGAGQNFGGTQWFQGRPSAAGTGYDAMNSGASNLSASNPTLLTQVQQRKAAIAKQDGVDPSEVPADALTASGSGLDPDISPAYAAIQVDRVAKARGLSVAQVQALVAANTEGRALGFIGQPRVNVLLLNLALAAAAR